MNNMKQPQEIKPNAVYTVAQAAEVLGMTPQGVGQWIRKGVLPGKGQRRYYHRRFTGQQLLDAIKKLNEEE